MIKVTFDRTKFAAFLEKLCKDKNIGNLEPETCMELAYFLEDCWSDGIEIDRLQAILRDTMEFTSARKLIEYYYTDEPYKMIQEEEGDLTDEECEEKLMERLQDDGMIILKTSNGYACIQN